MIAALIFIWNAGARADRSIRCDGRIVSIGSYKEQVLKLCGRPDHVEQWEVGRNSAIAEYYDYADERYRLPKLLIGPLHMERWTYDVGSNRLIRYLLFRNGELIKIETGGRGSD